MDRHMKKLLGITGAILAVYLLLTATVAPPVHAPEAAAYQAVKEADAGAWRIGEYEGTVTVFRGGEPVLRTDTRVSELPKSDRNRLAHGIDVYSQRELKKILEDLCS